MRRLWIALVVVVVIVAAAAMFAVSRVDLYLENNREMLTRQAAQALGRDVSFGEIGVALFPGVGAEVTEVVVGEDPSFGGEPFLQVERAVVAVKVLPALVGRYEVSRIVLESPRVSVIREPSGFNFASLGAARSGDPALGQPTAPAAGDAAVPLRVGALRVRDGAVRFVDRAQSAPTEMVVEQIDLSASDLGLDSEIDLDLEAAVLGEAEPNLSIAGSVGPVGALGSTQALLRAPLDLAVRVGPVVVERARQWPGVGAAIPEQLSVDGPVHLEADVDGSVERPHVKAAFDGTDAGLRYGAWFDKPPGATLAVTADATHDADAITVESLELRLADARLSGQGTIGTGAGIPVDFAVASSALPLDGWSAWLTGAADLEIDGRADFDVRARGPLAAGIPRLEGEIDLRGFSARQAGGGVDVSELTAHVALLGDRVEMAPTRFRVAGQPVQVAATVSSLRDLAAELTLTAPRLRLAAIGAGGAEADREEVLEDLAVEVSLTSTEGRPQPHVSVRSSGGSVRGIDYASFASEAAVVGDAVQLRQSSAEVFDGRVSAAGSYDGGAEPELEIRGHVDRLDVAAILGYLGATEVEITGKVEGDLNLRGSGPLRELFPAGASPRREDGGKGAVGGAAE